VYEDLIFRDQIFLSLFQEIKEYRIAFTGSNVSICPNFHTYPALTHRRRQITIQNSMAPEYGVGLNIHSGRRGRADFTRIWDLNIS
jgi:hypothetical protein